MEIFDQRRVSKKKNEHVDMTWASALKTSRYYDMHAHCPCQICIGKHRLSWKGWRRFMRLPCFARAIHKCFSKIGPVMHHVIHFFLSKINQIKEKSLRLWYSNRIEVTTLPTFRGLKEIKSTTQKVGKSRRTFR